MVFCWFGGILIAQPTLQQTQFASGFEAITGITHAGDGSGRIFVVEQRGVIKILDPINNNHTTFLDIQGRVNYPFDERGLLGLAFHPNYETNGYFYVNYTSNNNSETTVSRFSVMPGNSNQGNPNSESILMTISQPYSNHNGGDMSFGPNDGYLYISTGDGGSGGDPGNRSQNPQNLLGKMLRIDVDNGSPYGIPPSNPFVNDNSTLDEIWALGLRNAWRFSFDRANGDMWIADVGQNAWEEVDYEPAGSPGGNNYGWRCYEGNHSYNTSGCGPIGNYEGAIFEYDHTSGFSITGGYVYRGNAYPCLRGYYVFADYASDYFWTLKSDGAGGWDDHFHGDIGIDNVSTFGEDEAGELYVANHSGGIIYQLSCPVACPTPSNIIPEVISGNVVRLTWDVVTESNRYRIQYRTIGGSWIEKLTAATENFRFLNALTPNTTYEYRIKSLCASENSVWSTTSTFTTGSTLCDFPEASTTSVTGTTATLTWPTDPDDVKWKVQYRPSGGAWTQVTYNTSTPTLTGLSTSTTYFYKVKSKCDGGWTNWGAKYSFVTNSSVSDDENVNTRVTQDISLSPNPARDEITVQFNGKKVDYIKVVDINGKELIHLTSRSEQVTIDISDLSSGIYFLTTYTKNKKVSSQKFVKE